MDLISPLNASHAGVSGHKFADVLAASARSHDSPSISTCDVSLRLASFPVAFFGCDILRHDWHWELHLCLFHIESLPGLCVPRYLASDVTVRNPERHCIRSSEEKTAFVLSVA